MKIEHKKGKSKLVKFHYKGEIALSTWDIQTYLVTMYKKIQSLCLSSWVKIS